MFDTIRREWSRFRPVARFTLCVVLTSTMGSAGASALPAAIPRLEDCTLLELRMTEGWWVQIRKDEPAAYGFGALPQRVSVKDGTFSLEAIYRAIVNDVVEPYSDAPVTVLFSPMASGEEGRVFALEVANPLVMEIFAAAYRARDQALDDGFQQEAIRSLDPFWTRAPFLQ